MALLTQFPALKPNEHMISVAVRACRLSGARTINHYFQNSLNVIPKLDTLSFIGNPVQQAVVSAYSKIHACSAYDLMWNHTNFRYYFHVLPKSTQHSLLTEYAVNKTQPHLEHLRAKSQVNLARTWRWCPTCAIEDENEFGFSYWHVDHQIPGLLHCTRHTSTVLVEYCSHCSFRYDSLENLALPPTHGRCLHCQNKIEAPSTFTKYAKQLAKDSLDWMRLPPGQFSMEKLCHLYRLTAQQQTRFSFTNITPLSAIAHCTLDGRLQQLFEEFYGVKYLTEIAQTYRFNGEIHRHRISLRSLMRGIAIFHPVLHLLAIRFLAGGLNNFIKPSMGLNQSTKEHSALQFLRRIKQR